MKIRRNVYFVDSWKINIEIKKNQIRFSQKEGHQRSTSIPNVSLAQLAQRATN
jgi:hypothetical protein